MENKLSFRTVYRVVLTCIIQLYQFSKSYVILSILFTFLIGISPTVLLVLMQNIINEMQTGLADFSSIAYSLILYIIVDVSTSGISVLYGHFDVKTTSRFSLVIEQKLLDKALNLELSDYENSELHNLISRARNEGATKIISFFSNFLLIGKQIIAIIAAGTVVSIYKPYLILIALVLPVIKCVYAYRTNVERYHIMRNRTTRDRKLWYLSLLAFTGQSFKEIRLYGLKEHFIQKYSSLKQKSIAEDIGLSKRVSLVHFALGVLENVINGGIFATFLYGGFVGKILIGDVITYTRCVFNVSSSVESLFSVISTIAKDGLFVSQYFEFMDIEEKKQGTVIIDKIDTIDVCGLSYKYRGSNTYTLKDVSFHLSRGEKLLVVGLNGSGKTTLIKILLGFYDDYEGTILVNGIELRTINRSCFYSFVSSVFQDFTKYEGSVRENIAFGDISKIDNTSLLTEQLHKYGLFNLKVDDIIGSWFDNGKPLSGGEWQKIALCRAFMRKADFYVLDEPDAALDAYTENEVLRNYQNNIANGISLFTSHRFNKICFFATKVIVLQKGQVIEQGSHHDLMKQKGAYYNLYRSSNNM